MDGRMDGWMRNRSIMEGRAEGYVFILVVGFIIAVRSQPGASGGEELSHLSRQGVTEEHTASWLRFVIARGW